MDTRGHVMSLAVVKIAAFVVSDVVALWAAVSDATWLAAGTFVVTLGGVLKMLYQMRIDSQKDQSMVNLRLATSRIEALEDKAEVATNERQMAVEKLEAAESRARDLKAESDRLNTEVVALRKRQNQSSVMLKAINEERVAGRGMTPDPDNPVPVVIVKDLTNPPENP